MQLMLSKHAGTAVTGWPLRQLALSPTLRMLLAIARLPLSQPVVGHRLAIYQVGVGFARLPARLGGLVPPMAGTAFGRRGCFLHWVSEMAIAGLFGLDMPSTSAPLLPWNAR